jgi:uncharacterized protein (DUF885 family)
MRPPRLLGNTGDMGEFVLPLNMTAAPAQATSYFYGYSQLLALRPQVEQAMGSRFSAREFHDFILAQGLLPPELLREATMANFAK